MVRDFLGTLHFHMNFKICLSISKKNAGIHIVSVKFIGQFGKIWHLTSIWVIHYRNFTISSEIFYKISI